MTAPPIDPAGRPQAPAADALEVNKPATLEVDVRRLENGTIAMVRIPTEWGGYRYFPVQRKLLKQ